MRVRSRWFILSGALGGLAGFLLMEMVSVPGAGAGTFSGNLLRMSLYFAGFGLAVGIALGMTEGLAQKRPGRAIYGFFMGLILGALGGFAGGAIGQTIYSLVPRTHTQSSTSDLAIALDSSGSMKMLFFGGNDPWGERRSAAKNLIDRLSPTDRVAIVDFDDVGAVVHPLSFLGSKTAREAAKSAVDRIDNTGGTNLSAGLDAAIAELAGHKAPERSQFVIFLTDGEGEYSSESAVRAQQEGIKIYTLGLGDQVQTGLLQEVAAQTGGKYYPVASASELTALFEKIFREHGGAMVEAETTKSDINPLLLLCLRILSWAVMGLFIGLGQGIRENTREDLWACAFGGFLGGALGGALFDPVVNLVTADGGLAGRALADIVVGACIGGSMRLAQEKIVEASGKPTTTLISVLPQRASLSFRPSPASPPPPRPARAPVPPQPSWTPPSPSPAPVPAPAAAAATRAEPSRQGSNSAPGPDRAPLASFETGNDREMAMVLARRAGYGLGEIGNHFGLPATTVKRIISERGG